MAPTDRAMQPKPISFLQLPAEIRNLIYEYASMGTTVKAPIDSVTIEWKAPSSATTLFRTNKQIYAECHAVFVRERTDFALMTVDLCNDEASTAIKDYTCKRTLLAVRTALEHLQHMLYAEGPCWDPSDYQTLRQDLSLLQPPPRMEARPRHPYVRPNDTVDIEQFYAVLWALRPHVRRSRGLRIRTRVDDLKYGGDLIVLTAGIFRMQTRFAMQRKSRHVDYQFDFETTYTEEPRKCPMVVPMTEAEADAFVDEWTTPEAM